MIAPLFLDHSIASGKLLDQQQLGQAIASYWPFDACYSHYFAQGDGNRHQLSCSPDLIEVVLGQQATYKDKHYRFRSTLDGRRFKLSITEIMAFRKKASLVVPSKILSDIDEGQRSIFVRIEDINQLASLPRAVGIAIDYKLLTDDALSYLLQQEQQRSVLITGADAYQALASLNQSKNAHGLMVQLNGLFDLALEGKVLLGGRFISVKDAEYQNQHQPINPNCLCYTCKNHTLAYLHHLYQNTPLLAVQLMARHNFAVAGQ